MSIKISKQMRWPLSALAKIGGKAGAESMTQEQRLERAKKGGKASGIARAKKKADREAL